MAGDADGPQKLRVAPADSQQGRGSSSYSHKKTNSARDTSLQVDFPEVSPRSLCENPLNQHVRLTLWCLKQRTQWTIEVWAIYV